MQKFQFEWWSIQVKEATGWNTILIKSKTKQNAINQIVKHAKKHDEFVQKVRPDFHTEINWNSLVLDRKGYNREF